MTNFQMPSMSVTSANDVPACTPNEPVQQMGRNPLYDSQTVSEVSFQNRYTMKPADPSLNRSYTGGTRGGNKTSRSRRKSPQHPTAGISRGGGKNSKKQYIRKRRQTALGGGDANPIGLKNTPEEDTPLYSRGAR